jgi:hypothetical protein
MPSTPGNDQGKSRSNMHKPPIEDFCYLFGIFGPAKTLRYSIHICSLLAGPAVWHSPSSGSLESKPRGRSTIPPYVYAPVL